MDIQEYIYQKGFHSQTIFRNQEIFYISVFPIGVIQSFSKTIFFHGIKYWYKI
jgi:hypothetical protein